MVTQILFSIIKTRGRISILKEQISEMESDLSAINMFEEIKNNPSFKFLYYKRFLFISSKYTNYSVSDIIEEIKIKKKKLSQLQAYLQLLQNQYAHKRRKSWQRIKDIALTCGIEKLFEYGFSAQQKPDSYNQIIVCQGINETKNNYIIQQNNSKEQNLLIFGLPILFILIAAYYLLH